MLRFIVYSIVFFLLIPLPNPDRVGGPINIPGQTPTPTQPGENSPHSTPTPAAAQAEQSPGPYNAIGNPFLAAQNDNGFCGEGFVEMNNGAGGLPSLQWPLNGPTINDGRKFRVGHTGIDINGFTGQSIYAAGAGRVVFAGWSSWGFGNLVVLSHGQNWFTYYAHMSSPKQTLHNMGIDCGSDVTAGQLIGYVGRSGAATWPHLHFEVRHGYNDAYNPLFYLPQLE